ncbi:DUF1659 domain-containing protein [Lactobacillus sp. ESL0785]|uniref:DUF1659 domain-containing protein n=1 Tax=Lactobacillus sp. ESL0785 TaxID=2983232 RepID=UPI0023FA12B0|nr:DUF1659 domain-containing protein [Lactobacillus sp. ESL0785]WEV70760.1 DUF1659 domain-containing protein [Lactobacillus sp. ESL0785]
MNLELVDQSIEYVFLNEKYGATGSKSRIFRGVKKDATTAGLVNFGKALAALQGDDLDDATLVQKQLLPMTDTQN